MRNRKVPITPYQGGQNSSDKQHPESPINVHFHVSGMHNSGIEPDSLHSALAHRMPPDLPSDFDKWEHGKASKPTGAHYNPTQDYRKVKPVGKGKDVYSYGGAPNHKGENALGRALNHSGEKSGYKNFKPSGGGKRP